MYCNMLYVCTLTRPPTPTHVCSKFYGGILYRTAYCYTVIPSTIDGATHLYL